MTRVQGSHVYTNSERGRKRGYRFITQTCDGWGLFRSALTLQRCVNESLSRILLVNRLIRFTKEKRFVRDYGIVCGSQGLTRNGIREPTLSDSIDN